MKLALTGGIGCGKTTALDIFNALGCVTFSADDLCKEVYQKHEKLLIRAFSDRWSQNVLNNNGFINRANVAEIVFSDPDELAYLNGLLHPLIESEMNEKLSLVNEKEMVIVEIPLLFELKWEKRFDKVIAVWSPEEIVTQHLLDRGMTESDIVARQNVQISAEDKLKKADFGIINHGTKKALHEQCLKLYENLKEDYCF